MTAPFQRITVVPALVVSWRMREESLPMSLSANKEKLASKQEQLVSANIRARRTAGVSVVHTCTLSAVLNLRLQPLQELQARLPS
ncbi:hypothetical protein EYF80_027064 [Liparis tanakae]|uniref:Uncharacterized protein n=1 Tax=Liparis tanakae TaxID=230148 RepID=A0A4Z2HD60_9TELE|nr:hypothetical protein EYF80_027064 [Liparis tanakae]